MPLLRVAEEPAQWQREYSSHKPTQHTGHDTLNDNDLQYCTIRGPDGTHDADLACPLEHVKRHRPHQANPTTTPIRIAMINRKATIMLN